ncbi:TA system VapC family ribonuclease toxin [Meiothermus sp.]|uniref:TA system VapC family ribonuclease toxin n=1 Tax=Meiothermus sp. TaxID=1955249 RepID=UPI00307D940D
MNLPDTNFWFALLVPEHPFHPKALGFWEKSGEIALNRVVALGLLRLLTNSVAMGNKPLEVKEAWSVYWKMRLESGVRLLEEPQGLDNVLRTLVQNGITPRLWMDAYLAAFAIAGGCQLITFDQDFRRFDGLSYVLL